MSSLRVDAPGRFAPASPPSAATGPRRNTRDTCGTARALDDYRGAPE